jgi:hypothetical protein
MTTVHRKQVTGTETLEKKLLRVCDHEHEKRISGALIEPKINRNDFAGTETGTERTWFRTDLRSTTVFITLNKLFQIFISFFSGFHTDHIYIVGISLSSSFLLDFTGQYSSTFLAIVFKERDKSE